MPRRRRKDGSEFKHAVKPLRLIWDKVEGRVEINQ